MPGFDQTYEYWIGAVKVRARVDYHLRHCEVCLNSDLSNDVETVEQIAVDKFTQEFRKRASLEKEKESKEISRIGVFIPFWDAKERAKIEQFQISNVTEFHVSKNEQSEATDVFYYCSSEQLAAGKYPTFKYHETNRIRTLVDKSKWEWELINPRSCYSYNEVWGGKITYNLVIILPELHVPYVIHTSKNLSYSLGFREQKMLVHFPNFRKVSTISIAYCFAPVTHKFLIENPPVIIKNQSKINSLLKTLYNNFSGQSAEGNFAGTSDMQPIQETTNKLNSLNNTKVSVLLIVADPTNASRLRLGEELREIQEKLQLAKLREQFDLQQRMSVRPADISQALLDVQPKIVHFSGHGTATGALCFENPVGEIHPIQPNALAALFEQFANQVSCVVLNACYSEIQANAIAQHINYVIGMNQAIGDKAAIAFAIGFYQALGAGRTVEDAYKLGCVQIGLQDIPENLTPVLVKKGQSRS